MSDLTCAIHMHSDYSHDGLDSLEHLRDLCIARRIGWVGMTDHAEDLSADVFEEFRTNCAAVSDERVHIEPGLEYRFAGLRGVHLLAIGLSEWITPTTPEEFFDQTARHARLTVLAHPVLCHYTAPQVVLDRVDAIEVWNTNYNTRHLPDPRAMDLYHEVHARRPEVVATVGLDQHDGSNDREVRIIVPAADAADPAAAIRAGRFSNIGRNMRFDSRAALPAAEMRRLRIRRRALDAVNTVHDRVVFAARRLGVDV